MYAAIASKNGNHHGHRRTHPTMRSGLAQHALNSMQHVMRCRHRSRFTNTIQTNPSPP